MSDASPIGLAGEYFDIRDFHSVVLENGPVPLRILESLVDNWIQNHHRSKANYQEYGEEDVDCVCPPNAVVSAKCSASSGSGGARTRPFSQKTVLIVVALFMGVFVRTVTCRSSFIYFVDR